MKKQFTFFLILIFMLGLIPANFLNAADLANKLKGKILLQVEQNGEAWYVSPADEKRYFMGRPDDAFDLMKILGVGISNNDLRKIQIADANLSGNVDGDGDGLSKMIEDSLGTSDNNINTDNDGYNDKEEVLNGFNPVGDGELNIDNNFADDHAGEILLQVEQNGEAWYINPGDNKRYFLGRPQDAFNIMRSLGLGITNDDLNLIIPSDNSSLFIRIDSPNNNAIIYEEPFYIQGITSVNCDKIVATAINSEYKINDVYTLQNYKHGDSTFKYGIKHAWNNLDVGKNEYTFTAYCDKGEIETKINVFFEAGGGAEMGKPVIYLYPQKKQQVFVLPKPEGGITITEPELGNGWNVTAHPDGKIIDKENRTWPYLFWEGFSHLKMPAEGFFVHHNDLKTFFDEKLSYLGLIDKEIMDFEAYWLKQLDENKYYFISFIPQSELDEHAPILVEPKPDTIIRVFFDYKIFDIPFNFTEQLLKKGPERKGFTLIEWGGRLY